MKASTNGDLFGTTVVFKIAAFFFVAVSFFYLGKHCSDGYPKLIFFTATTSNEVSTSSNFNKFFNISALINQNQTQTLEPQLSPPPQPMIKKLGILNEDGTMSEEFEVGEFDPETVEEWVNETRVEDLFAEASNPKLVMKKFALCPRSMSEHIPCLDNAEAIEKLESTERGERFKRHCPPEKKRFNCLVHRPKGTVPDSMVQKPR